jgi:hypothetical protein
VNITVDILPSLWISPEYLHNMLWRYASLQYTLKCHLLPPCPCLVIIWAAMIANTVNDDTNFEVLQCSLKNVMLVINPVHN